MSRGAHEGAEKMGVGVDDEVGVEVEGEAVGILLDGTRVGGGYGVWR